MKIGDEIYVHGYVDEMRQGVVIIRNEGGYFGTVSSEIKPRAISPKTFTVDGITFVRVDDKLQRMFETKEITKLLDVMIGKVEAVGEENEDKRRLDNLRTLIDVTNWCMDGLQYAMDSGHGRLEASMHEIGFTAQCALDEYREWIEGLWNN